MGLAYHNVLPSVWKKVISLYEPWCRSVFWGLCTDRPSWVATWEKVLFVELVSTTTFFYLIGIHVLLPWCHILSSSFLSPCDLFPSKILSVFKTCLEISFGNEGISSRGPKKRSQGRQSSHRGLHGPVFSGSIAWQQSWASPVQSKNKNFIPGLAQLWYKIKSFGPCRPSFFFPISSWIT